MVGHSERALLTLGMFDDIGEELDMDDMDEEQ